MASILRNNLQEKALEEINLKISEVQLLNKAICSQKTFSFPVSGARKSVALDIIYNDKVKAILRSQRAKRIKDIRNQAARFQIGLSDDDEKILEDLPKDNCTEGKTTVPNDAADPIETDSFEAEFEPDNEEV